MYGPHARSVKHARTGRPAANALDQRPRFRHSSQCRRRPAFADRAFLFECHVHQQLALLLTDIVDSTAWNVSLGDASMAELWVKHDGIARALIREHHGREIGRSDGFLVTFGSVSDAARLAASYHRALDAFKVPLRARIGIHVGDVDLRRNSPEDTAAGATVFDLDGVALPLTARIAALAGARQTLVSAAAAAQLSSSLALISHGHWQLKGIPEPVEIFEAGDDESAFMRPEDGLKAYQVVFRHETWQPAREIRNSIPSENDEFSGRRAELRRLSELLDAGARMISVVGIGGVGKTRLATHFARRWLGEFPSGAWFCDLAQARDLDGIFSAVAQGLDVALGRSDPRRQLADVIEGRGSCLVILDNFEQVARLAAESVGHWLDKTTKARFIATTRERLGVIGEHVVPVDSLDPGDAASMFISRAGASQPQFRVDAGNSRTIHQLVELLDGLPLAIELAAGRLTVMSAETMLARIGQRFTLLATRTGRLKRQSTLRAAFDWSWDLLNANERSLLAQASTFAGGFTLEAAEGVLQLPTDDGQASILDTLQSLVDKSFVRTSDDSRFGLLVSVREYAFEKLRDTEPPAAVAASAERTAEARHGAFYSRPLEGDVRHRAADLDNVLVACRRAIARKDGDIAARSCAAAWAILEVRGPYRVGLELIEACLAMPEAAVHEKARLSYMLGRCLLVLGETKRARVQLAGALTQAQALGLVADEVRTLASLAELNLTEGEIDVARLQYEEAIRRGEGLGNEILQCSSSNGFGLYFNRLGQFDDARSWFNYSLGIARPAGLRRWEGAALSNLGNVEANLGNRRRAEAYYDEAIEVARELGERVWEANLLCNVGLFKLDEGDSPAAAADLDRSLVLARENGLSLLESVVLCNIGLLRESVGDVAGAEDSYRQALERARRRADRRSEGQFLGYLGLLVAKRGDVDNGRLHLAESISILRQVKDRLSLAISLCSYAQACRFWGELESGRRCLTEAEAIALDINVETGSELATSLGRARQAVAADGELGPRHVVGLDLGQP